MNWKFKGNATIKLIIICSIISLTALTLKFLHPWEFDIKGTITKGLIGKQDLALMYSGDSAETFTRATSTGYTMTLNKIDWPGVDVCYVFGGGVTKTSTVIASAITAIGTTEKVEIYLSRGAWPVTGTLTIPANITIHFAIGAYLDGSGTAAFKSYTQIKAQEGQQIYGSSVVITFEERPKLSIGHWGGKGDWNNSTGTDNTTAFNKALACIIASGDHDNGDRGVIIFPRGNYLMGATNHITTALTIDFQNSKIIPNTTGIVFYVDLDPDDRVVGTSDGTVFQDGLFYGGSGQPYQPTNLIYFDYYALAPKMYNISARYVFATGALFYHKSGAGLVARDITITDSTANSGFSFIVSSDPKVFSNAIVLDHINLTDFTGIGISTNGGDLIVRDSIVQGCSGGGINHDGGVMVNNMIIENVWFEGNTSFDVSCGVSGTYGGEYSISRSRFLGSSLVNHILVNGNTKLTTSGNMFEYGGIFGAVDPGSYVGINNSVRNVTAGYTTGSLQELSNDIQTVADNVVIVKNNNVGFTKTFTSTPTPASGAFTSASASIRYTKIGRMIQYNATLTVTDIGTASGIIILTLPFPITNTKEYYATGRNVTTNSAVTAIVNVYGLLLTCTVTTGQVVQVSGTYYTL